MNTTPDLQQVVTEIAEEMRQRPDRGDVATYIPELARADPAPGAEPTHAIPPRDRIVRAAANVDSDGRREVLGKVIGASKLETVCLGFSRWLTSGGLRSAELVIPHINAEAVQNHLDGQAKMAKTNH